MEEKDAQPQPQSKSARLYLIIGLLIGIIIVGSISAIVLIYLIRSNKESSTTKPPKLPQSATKPPKSDNGIKDKERREEIRDEIREERGQKIIAYIDGDNVWVMNADGTNKRQITDDGDGEIHYTYIAFKDRNNLSYVYCVSFDNCNRIYTHNLTTDVRALEQETSAESSHYIRAITWSDDGTKLAYFYSTPESEHIYVKGIGEPREVKEIERTLLGRGGSFEDQQKLQFSPDGNKLLVVYTFNLPDDGPSIFVLNPSTGEELTTIGVGEQKWATHAFFIDNNNIGYKLGDKLIKYSIPTAEEINLTRAVNNQNPEISADRNFIAFWTYSEEESADLYLFDVADSFVKIADDMSDPQWLSGSALVAFNTATCPDCMYNYTIVGLGKVDTRTRIKTVLLNSETIKTFRVSP